MDAGQSVVIVVDGFEPADAGDFTLSVTELPTSELSCDDGLDDDLDGLIDCDDPDCALEVRCTPVCPQGSLGVPPETVYASTVGQLDQQDPGCVQSNAGDLSWEFTAPADGSYTFDTVGSNFDTVLFALDSCGGTELACNDDTVGVRSEITVDLLAGETILVVVDGWSTSEGDVVLNTQ